MFLSTSGTLPFTHEQYNISGINLGVPRDTSRTTANATSGAGRCNSSNPFYRDISSCYGSIKRILPGQYGTIFSYNPIDTGAYGKFVDDTGALIKDFPIVYGGDCFINRFGLKIKHPFFLKSTVNKPDGFDIDYNQDTLSETNTGNVGYPIWYYSTTNQQVILSSGTINSINTLASLFTGGGLLFSVLSLKLFFDPNVELANMLLPIPSPSLMLINPKYIYI